MHGPPLGRVGAASTLDRARLEAESAERSRAFGEPPLLALAGVFAVQLVEASGANGDDNTAPSWQYDLFADGADTATATPLATSLIPLCPRAVGDHLRPSPLVGLAARFGGELVLLDAYERINTEPDPCPPASP